MKKSKLSLLAATAVCAVAATAMVVTTVAAAADDYRDVTLTGTNVFYAGVGGANIAVTRVSDDTEDGYTDYTSFQIGADETITFRKNLAYSWWAADEEGNGVHNTFSMTIGFEELNFQSYVIRFQSQQYMLTEDGVSDNYLVFVPDGENLNLYVSQTEEIEDGEEASVVLADYSFITISFGEYGSNVNGNYPIIVNGQPAGQSSPAEFVNVRENYASYVSSGDSAATPLTFSATFAEDAADDAESEMIMYSLNGQSFEVFGAETTDEGTLTGGTIHDDQAPVVCLDNGVNYLTYGEAVDIDYTVIDVITSSPRTTVNYYVLTYDQFSSSDLNYNDTSEEAGLFMEITTSSDYRLLRDADTYVPDLTDSGIAEIDGYKTYGLAKVCLYVRDTTSTRAQSDYVFMDWYVPAEYRVDIADLKTDASSSVGSTFIRIVEDLQGATYTKTGAVDFSDFPADADANDVALINEVSAEDFVVNTPENYQKYVAAVQAYYQYKIDEYIAENYPDGLYASSEANLYLPDFAGYISDNLGGYTDLSYRIYYSASSESSTSALAYNQLALTVSEADITYRFTIYATDAAENGMRYISDVDDGNPVYSELSADDIWEDDYADLLPRFEVTVSYKAATVEKPDIQSVGYVGSTYNSASFDITGVSGTYSTAYNLYIFDRDALYADTGIDLTYDEVIANIEDLFFNRYEGVENTRQYFTLVTDDEQYADYEWNSTNVTFVPQNPSEYYVVRLTLKDTGLSNAVTDSFLVVRASARAAEIYGEDNWVQNNVAAIVLFSVAGACLIAFVVLLIVKPKDKGDIDVIAEQVESKAKKSKKKNK